MTNDTTTHPQPPVHGPAPRPSLGDRLYRVGEVLGAISLLALLGSLGALCLDEYRRSRTRAVAAKLHCFRCGGSELEAWFTSDRRGIICLECAEEEGRLEELDAREVLADEHRYDAAAGECLRDSGDTCRNEGHYPRVHGDNLHPECARCNTGRDCPNREHYWPISEEHGDLIALAERLPSDGHEECLRYPSQPGQVLDERAAELARNAHAPGAAAASDPAVPGGEAAGGGESDPGPES